MDRLLTSRKTWPLLLVGALMLTACGGGSDSPDTGPPPAEGEGVLGQWVSAGGYVRTYELFVPENPDNEPLPLLIALHGAGGSGRGFRAGTALDDEAGPAGYVVAYPTGLGSWAIGLGTAADRAGVDDVGFIRTLISHLAASLPIDRRRIHITGFSDGATMTYRLGCEMTGELASITAVASGVPDFDLVYGAPSQPLPVQVIGGTEDHIFGWDNVRETARKWARFNGCNTVETETLPQHAGDTVEVHRTLCGDCRRDAEVILFVIEGMGHTWPEATTDPDVVGFSASRAVIEFASRHSR